MNVGPVKGTKQGESRVSQAIRYMFDHRCTQAEAARRFEISRTTISVSLRRYDEHGNLRLVRVKQDAASVAQKKRAYHERTRDRRRGRKRKRDRRRHTLAIAAITAEGVQNAVEIGSALAIQTHKAIYLVHTETAGHKPGEVTGIRLSW